MRFTEEQQLLRKTVREFVEKEVKPVAAEVDQQAKFPAENVRKMAGLGLFGVPVAAEWGGVGAGFTGYCLVVEELARGCMSHTTIVGAHTSLCCLPLQAFGTPDQKDRYLRKLAAGEWLGAFALTEPHAGSDAANIKTAARQDGEEWVLDGTKTWITNGKEANLVIVVAVNDPAKGPRGGMTAFLVEKGTEGFRVGSCFDKMGIRGSSACELVFNGCRVPKENVLGKVGEGFRVALSTLYAGRMTLGAGCLGGSTAALEAAMAYSRERKAFGGPLAEKQAIQFKLADMAAGVYTMRTLVYDLAARMDGGELPAWDTAIVKLVCSEIAHDIVDEAVQVFGGYGYSKDYPVERYYRDQRVTEIFEGTSEVQRLIIAEELLKRGLAD